MSIINNSNLLDAFKNLNWALENRVDIKADLLG